MPKNSDSQPEQPPIFRREDGYVNIDLDRLPPGQREEMEALAFGEAECSRAWTAMRASAIISHGQHPAGPS